MYACGSINIPATSCPWGVCVHLFDDLNSSCLLNSSQISLITFATNFIGNGLQSPPMIIGMYVFYHY